MVVVLADVMVVADTDVVQVVVVVGAVSVVAPVQVDMVVRRLLAGVVAVVGTEFVAVAEFQDLNLRVRRLELDDEALDAGVAGAADAALVAAGVDVARVADVERVVVG